MHAGCARSRRVENGCRGRDLEVAEPWCCEPGSTDGPEAPGGITVCCLPDGESTRGSRCADGRLPGRRHGLEALMRWRPCITAAPASTSASARSPSARSRRDRAASPSGRRAASAPSRRDLLAPRRLARRARDHGGGDGVDRQLLEADLEPARGPLRAAARQRRPHQGRARSQDRRPGRRVDRRPASATACCGRASSRPAQIASCASSSATGRRSSASGHPRSTASPRCSRAPTSSSAR